MANDYTIASGQKKLNDVLTTVTIATITLLVVNIVQFGTSVIYDVHRYLLIFVLVGASLNKLRWASVILGLVLLVSGGLAVYLPWSGEMRTVDTWLKLFYTFIGAVEFVCGLYLVFSSDIRDYLVSQPSLSAHASNDH